MISLYIQHTGHTSVMPSSWQISQTDCLKEWISKWSYNMISEVLVKSSILSSHKHTLSTTRCLPRFSTCSLSCTLLKWRVSAARHYLQLLGHSMCKFVVWSPTLTQAKSSLANQALSADPLANISSLDSQNIYSCCCLSREPFQPNLSRSHCAGTEQPQAPLLYLSFSPPSPFFECWD